MYNVVQSGADGYTLAMTLTGMLSINPVIYKKAGFAASDFVPVARVSLAPLLLVVPEKSPYKSVQDLLAAGKKAGKGGMAYGSAGAGGLSHLASESINGHANGNFTHVPYKGGAPLVQALMANEVAWGCSGHRGQAVRKWFGRTTQDRIRRPRATAHPCLHGHVCSVFRRGRPAGRRDTQTHRSERHEARSRTTEVDLPLVVFQVPSYH